MQAWIEVKELLDHCIQAEYIAIVNCRGFELHASLWLTANYLLFGEAHAKQLQYQVYIIFVFISH